MLKKLISYQRLLLNSSPPLNMTSQNMPKILLYVFTFFIMIFIDISIFTGNTSSSNNILPICLPVISIWMINRILYSNNRLYEIIPVNRKYIVLNVFLLSLVIVFAGYLIYSIAILFCAALIFGILYLVSPQSITSPPEVAVNQIIETTKGNMLMLCIFITILFAGVAITFIKNKKLRFSSFTGFTIIGYGLLLLLKLNMPISPSTGKIEFLESFSIMPQANTILYYVFILTILTIITSVIIVHKLYVGKSDGINPSYISK